MWSLAIGLLAALPAAGQDSLAVIPPAPAIDSVAAPCEDFDAFFAAAITQRPDSTRLARVKDFTFARDAGRFTLIEGNLWLGTPVMGRVCTAVFEGRGS